MYMYIVCMYVHPARHKHNWPHTDIKPAHLKFEGQSVFVPVEFSSYSAMKPHSMCYVDQDTHTRQETQVSGQV